MDPRVIPISNAFDILPQFRGTPVELLIEYHNLERPFEPYTAAQLLVGMCMDSRKHLRIPENFAYIIRSGGGNLRYAEFKVSYAIAIGGVKAIALLAHNNCGMVNLMARREQFVSGLVKNGGWSPEGAQEFFFQFAPMFEIGNETDFTISEAKRLRLRYPGIIVAPLFYNVNDNKLYHIQE